MCSRISHGWRIDVLLLLGVRAPAERERLRSLPGRR
jgi:hypothetical protein